MQDKMVNKSFSFLAVTCEDVSDGIFSELSSYVKTGGGAEYLYTDQAKYTCLPGYFAHDHNSTVVVTECRHNGRWSRPTPINCRRMCSTSRQ